MSQGRADQPPQAPSLAQPILLLDRQPIVVATLGDTLSRAGFTVTRTTSALEALEHAQAAAHAIAIVDQSTFELEGPAYAAAWAQLAVPLAFMTADGSPERIGRAIEAGAVACFLKPVDPAQLVPAVHVALQRSRERKALATEVDRLREVVDDRNEIGIAVGLLMAQRGLPRQTAFDMLRQHARRSRRRVSAVASEIASLASRLNDIQHIPAASDRKPGASVLRPSRPSRGAA